MNRTIVDLIEPTADGVLQIRLRKQSVDALGQVTEQGFHRTSIEPGGNAALGLDQLNTAIARLDAGAIAEDDWQQVVAAVAQYHTPAVIARFEAARAALTT